MKLKNKYNSIPLLIAFSTCLICPEALPQQIYPSGIYGASNASNANGLTMNWILGSLVSEKISALPVKLISFDGILTINGDALLQWTTAQESGNKGFELQKSVDGKSFENIGWIEGNGEYEGVKTYRFTDFQLYTTSYYRLKQIDYDGKFTLSRIVSVIPKNESLDRFIAFPNPSEDGEIKVEIPDKTFSLSLISQEGRILLDTEKPSGSQKLILPFRSMHYYLHIQCKAGDKTLHVYRK